MNPFLPNHLFSSQWAGVRNTWFKHTERGRFRKKLTMLSVSLFNGRFKALSIIKNKIHLGWEKPETVVFSENIGQALEEAISYTEFPGSYLSILIDDPSFLHRTIQVPPMETPDLLAILERKAQQEKTFDGPAAWRYRVGLEARGIQNVQLEIWPQSLIDDLVPVCERLGLHLRQLASLSALSESQLSSLPVSPGDGTLLITILDGKITILAGRDDGSLLFTRHLQPAQIGLSLADRLGTEANRTLRYINQQIQLSIPQVWFLGEEGSLKPEDIQPHLPIPVLPCPVNPDWKYWLWVGATLSPTSESNFTPPQVLRAPLRALLNKSMAAMVGLILIISIGTTAIIQGYLSKNLSAVYGTAVLSRTLQEERARWNGLLVTLRDQRQWAQTILKPEVPPIEGPFLSYLGQVVPSQIILQKASITRTSQGWEVELAGTAHQDLSTTLQLLDGLVQELRDSPYHLTVQPEWRDHLLTQTASMRSQVGATPVYRFTIMGGIG